MSCLSLQKQIHVSRTLVRTEPRVFIRSTHTSVYVQSVMRGGTVTKVTYTRTQQQYNKHLHNINSVLPTGIFSHSSHSCLYRNGGCDHFCTEISESMHECECAPGYRLQTDNTSCVPEGLSQTHTHTSL